MLPKISAALSQFVAPIASSNQRALIQREQQGGKNSGKPSSKKPSEKKEDHSQSGQNASQEGPPQEGFQRYTPQQRPAQQSPEPVRHLHLVPDEARPQTPSAEKPLANPKLSVAQTFVQLVSIFQNQRFAFVKWLGHLAYQAAIRRQKKVGRFEKGAMLDQKAE